MLDIVINNKTYTYISSVKIDDNCYLAYTDGIDTYISEFHYENEKLILNDIDDDTFKIVSEVIA